MFFVPIPRDVAKERGLKTYFSGQQCRKFGLIAYRFTSNCNCLCVKHREIANCHSQTWRDNNPEQSNASWKNYDSKNPEKRKAADQRYKERNRSVLRERRRIYVRDNLDKVNATSRTRKMAHKQAIPTWYNELDEFVFTECCSLTQLRKNVTGFNWEVDHLIPIRAKVVCGLHVWNNFQCLPRSVNASKQNKLIYTNPHEWLYDIPKFFKVVHQQEIAA